MLHGFKQMIHRFKARGKCRFGKDTTIDSKAHFEGANKLADGVTFLNSSLGYASYISNDSFIKNTVIGKYCSIGTEVLTIAGNHPTDFVSSHPAFYSTTLQSGITYMSKALFREFNYIDDRKKISVAIGNDVWIGSRVTILEGISIGDGAIIAAGAVVTKDVQPYAIVGGCPAKTIRYRFDKETVQKLLELKWWNRSEQWIRENAYNFNDIVSFFERIENEKS